MSLPISYDFEGTVMIVDEEDKLINQTVTIFVGGYSTEVFSGDSFILKFASEHADYFYATIEYTDRFGNKVITTEKIEINNKTKIKKVIKIYV